MSSAESVDSESDDGMKGMKRMKTSKNLAEIQGEWDILHSWTLDLESGRKRYVEEDKSENESSSSFADLDIDVDDLVKITIKVYNTNLYFYIDDKKIGNAFDHPEIKSENVFPVVIFHSDEDDSVELLKGSIEDRS